MSHTLGARAAQKARTRQAFLDAGLRLVEDQSLSSVGLREITREVGVAPAGFYRHFRDLADLGVALVEESFGSLHPMVRALRGEQVKADEVIDGTVEVIARYVRDHRAHFRFIARERHGGVRRVREAIAAGLNRFTEELAADLAAQPASAGWSTEDVRMLADLYVEIMVATAADFLEVPPGQPASEERIAFRARRQLRLIAFGRRHWLDDPGPPAG